MNVIKSEKCFNGQSITYEILGDGYVIHLSGSPWFSQHEPYIPYPDLGYEGSCLKQIDDIITPHEPEPDLRNQVEQNTANIAFLSVMMDMAIE